MKSQQFRISTTVACFGTREDFYKTFMKGNRIVHLEETEFEGNDQDHKEPQHNMGVVSDTLTVNENETLVEAARAYVKENSFESEYFGVFNLDGDEEIINEDDLEI